MRRLKFELFSISSWWSFWSIHLRLKWFASFFWMLIAFFNITGEGEKNFCFVERSIKIRDFSVSSRQFFLWDNFQLIYLKDKRFPVAWPITFDHFRILWKKKISICQRGDWNLSFFYFLATLNFFFRNNFQSDAEFKA